MSKKDIWKLECTNDSLNVNAPQSNDKNTLQVRAGASCTHPLAHIHHTGGAYRICAQIGLWNLQL
jgi:hypothetical protein